VITRITIDTVENAFCNATNNSWRYEMILDRRLLHFDKRYLLSPIIFPLFNFDMYQRINHDTEVYIKRLFNEIA
jgi:hypothetical protein